MTEKKLRPKYVVSRIDEEKEKDKALAYGSMPSVSGPPMMSTDPDNTDSPFVLMPKKDPAAFYALLHYTQACEEDLAREIRTWLVKVAEAPVEYGTQGNRNRIRMKMKQMDIME